MNSAHILIGLLVLATHYQQHEAGPLTRSFSSSSLEVQSNNLADSNSLRSHAKPNKVSKTLHLLHDKSRDLIYSGTISFENKSSESEQNWDGKTDDEILAHVCDVKPSYTCLNSVKVIKKMDPKFKSEVIGLIKNKPKHVTPGALLAHYLFGHGIEQFESRGYDEKLNKMIDVAATKNPYLFAASKGLDMIV